MRLLWIVLFASGCAVIRPRQDANTDAPAAQDPLAAICQHRVGGTGGCSEACNAAVGAAQAGACGSYVGAVSSHPEAAILDSCLSGCDVVRLCANGTQLVDCGCIAGCVRLRSGSMQSAFTTASSCIDAQIAGTCF